MSRPPDHVFDVVRPETFGKNKTFWLPVGRISMWIERDPQKISGRLELNMFPGEFRIFERDKERDDTNNT